MYTITTVVIVGCLIVTTFQTGATDEYIIDKGFDKETVEGSIVQVSMVVRHGERTPKIPYPTDPYRDLSYWPEGWEQLTVEGARQHKRLGHWTRERYANFIPEIYRTSEIFIRSTGSSSALASAFAFSYALFPGQAIPIHSAESKHDKLFLQPCPAADIEKDRFLNTQDTKYEERKMQYLYNWLTFKTGKEVKNLDDIEQLYSLLTIERQRGLNPPSWTDLVYPQPLMNISRVYFNRYSATPLLARLRYGSLLKDILNHASHAGGQNGDIKFLLYGAHDLNLIGLLNIMDLFDGIPCGFASSIIFEVRRGNEEYGNRIDIFYRNESVVEPKRLIVEKCGDPCYVKNLKNILETFLPEDIDEECKDQRSILCSIGGDLKNRSIFLAIALGSAVIGAILIICSTKVFNCCKCQPVTIYQPHRWVQNKKGQFAKIDGFNIGPMETIYVY